MYVRFVLGAVRGASSSNVSFPDFARESLEAKVGSWESLGRVKTAEGRTAQPIDERWGVINGQSTDAAGTHGRTTHQRISHSQLPSNARQKAARRKGPPRTDRKPPAFTPHKRQVLNSRRPVLAIIAIIIAPVRNSNTITIIAKTSARMGLRLFSACLLCAECME